MTLQFLPYLTGDNTRDIETLHEYLLNLIETFANSAGEAIDPTLGQGGDGALTVESIPTISTVSGSTLAVDGVVFGHIDITFTKPDRVVEVVIGYRETSVLNYSYIKATDSPARLSSLKVGAAYNIIIAGQAANGSRGDFSTPITVTIPTDIISSSPLFILNNITQNRLLGRGSTSGNGPAQQITLGSGVLLTGTVLSATVLSTRQLIRKTSDQGFVADGNVSQMLFNVEAGRYYNIRFVVIASSDVGQGGVGFNVTYPTATRVAWKQY